LLVSLQMIADICDSGHGDDEPSSSMASSASFHCLVSRSTSKAYKLAVENTFTHLEQKLRTSDELDE